VARLLYGLPSGAITDVVAVGSENNVRGSITTTSGTTHYSASALAQPLGTSSPFYSALYNGCRHADSRRRPIDRRRPEC
jgi:hypothetical protein